MELLLLHIMYATSMAIWSLVQLSMQEQRHVICHVDQKILKPVFH